MKKIIVLVALVVTSTISFGQSVFDKLENMDGVDAVIVNKDAFEILSKFKDIEKGDSDAVVIFNMIKELEEFKTFSTKNASIATKMEKMVETAVKKSSLTQLMRIKEGNNRVKIYVKATKSKDIVSEVVMFVKNSSDLQTVVVSLTGKIDVNKLSQLADKYTNGKNN